MGRLCTVLMLALIFAGCGSGNGGGPYAPPSSDPPADPPANQPANPPADGSNPPAGNRGRATHTDFNGDGYADLAIGVPAEDVDGVADAGAVHVFYGSSGQPSSDQLWHLNTTGLSTSAAANDRFGSAVTSADFNRDGYTDLAIGIPNRNGTAGMVLVLYGSASGLTANGRQLWQQGANGILDSAESDDFFGAALTAGDFNNDGYPDLVIGAPGEDFPDVGNPALDPPVPQCDQGMCVNAGIVNLILGGANGLTANNNQLWHQDRGTSGYDGWVEWQDCFGSSLASGDFNGDGVGDLAVGVPCEHTGGGDIPGRNHGAVSVYYGQAGTGLTGTESMYLQQHHYPNVPGDPQPDDAIGYSIAAGDFNGDGFDDLAIGVPGEDVDTGNPTDAGAILVFSGTSGGLDKNRAVLWHKNSNGILDDPQAGDRFGAMVAVGDFNNDGYADVAIGVPRDTVGGKANAGSVSILYGGPGGISASGNQLFTQDGAGDAAEAGDQFGYTLQVADFNGDGIDDLLIGAPFENDAGAVHVLHGVQGSGISTAGSGFLSQGSLGATDSAESGDQFGGHLIPRLYNNALP